MNHGDQERCPGRQPSHWHDTAKVGRSDGKLDRVMAHLRSGIYAGNQQLHDLGLWPKYDTWICETFLLFC